MVKTSALTKKYGRKLALDNVDITLQKGEIVALLGQNGAGKTTLLRILSGLLCESGGTALIEDKPPRDMCDKLSFITGEGSYFPAMRIGTYGEFLQDLHCAFDIERYKKLCDFFALDESDKISRLSTGQRARVELAAGFAKRSEYIFMDEPFLGKDVFTRRDFLKLMSGALHGNETIVLCTHYVEEIENFVDRALIMHNGKLEMDVKPEELREKGETLVDAMAAVCGWDASRHIVLE